jgi:hypothetical protein
MKTNDGLTISFIEQDGKYAGQDMGRLWVGVPNNYTWYGGFAVGERDRYVLLAQAMTAEEFDDFFVEAKWILKISHADDYVSLKGTGRVQQ